MIMQRDQLVHTIKEQGQCDDIMERLELLDQATDTLGVLVQELIQNDTKKLLFGGTQKFCFADHPNYIKFAREQSLMVKNQIFNENPDLILV